MKKVLLLTKIFFKNSFKFNYNNSKSDQTVRKKIITSVLILILMLYLAGVFGFISYQMITMLIGFNQEALFLGGFLLSTAALGIFQSIISSINIFYFSKDVEYVLPLPLKPWQIILAKFNTLLIAEYCTEFLFALVPLIVYGVLTTASFMFYIYGILILLIFPILPAVIVTLLIMVIMSFAKFTKNRDIFQVVVSIIAIALAIGVQFVVKDTEYTEEQMMEMITKANGMVSAITRYFPTVEPSLDAMIGANEAERFIGFAKLAGATAAGVVVFMFIGNKMYLRGAVGNTENSGNKKRFIAGAGEYKQNKPGVVYFLKEMKMLFRNPVYLLQCVMPVILIPVLFLVIILNGSSMEATGMEQMKNVLENAKVESTMFALIVIGVIHFMFMFAYTTITAVSRDGKNAVFMKHIPISLHKQFIYKMMPGLVFSVVQILMVLGVVIYIFPSISILFLLTIFAVSVLLSIFQNYIYLMVDLKRPKLEWDSEYAVVKQNMNMIYQFGVIFLIIGLLALIGFLVEKVNVSEYVVLSGMMLVSGVGIFIVDKYVRKNEEKLFEKIV